MLSLIVLYLKLFLCSQLELQSTGPSIPSIIMDEEGNIMDSRAGSSEQIQFVFEDIHWTSEISRQEAARRLEVTLYPFKKVKILNIIVSPVLGVKQRMFHCFLVVVLHRCPTCLFLKPSSEPKQIKSWCIPFCFGER